MTKTKWLCEECKQVGSVEHDNHAGVFEVVNLIQRDHAVKDHSCDQGLNQVRITSVEESDAK